MEAHAIAMRKKVLIAEGAAHRARLADAAVQVKTGLQPGELVNAGRRVASCATADWKLCPGLHSWMVSAVSV